MMPLNLYLLGFRMNTCTNTLTVLPDAYVTFATYGIHMVYLHFIGFIKANQDRTFIGNGFTTFLFIIFQRVL